MLLEKILRPENLKKETDLPLTVTKYWLWRLLEKCYINKAFVKINKNEPENMDWK